MELEQCVAYFSIFGGIDDGLILEYDEDILQMLHSHLVEDYEKYKALVSPSYLLEAPYKAFLMAIAKGDGKIDSAFKKAKLSTSLGERILDALITMDIVSIEYSREAPLRVHPKQKLKKEQRAYRIQDKVRFKKPFLRFWFAFVAYYDKELLESKGARFLENFQKHSERLSSLVYEQLSNALIEVYFLQSMPLVTSGSYWNIYSEFDILALSKSNKIILGECKYKDRKVCKNELTKLSAKAEESGIKVDIFILFSKSGFSKELLALASDSLLLFDLEDLKRLL